ncbi:MAG: hypothetical protein Q7R50_02785 [Dehalococcoidales bacterium]|nr:hypothetical protein [Dehalococcoidales bacterium]
MKNNYAVRPLLILVAGLVIGIIAAGWYNAGHKVRLVEGYSSGTNYNGAAIGISREVGGTGASEGYRIAGAMWREFGGPWHDQGTPPTLAWPSYGQKVRLGVVDYEPSKSAPGGSAVLWLEVIDTEHTR